MSGNYTATNASGVTYNLTYNGGLFGIGASYDLKITNPDGSSQTITGIPAGNVLTSNGGTLSIASLLLGGTYVIPPGVTGSISIVASVATLTPQQFYIGGSATISTVANVLSGSVIHVDGGSAVLSSDIVASALSSTTVDLTYGGTFGNGSGLITALSGTTINFGIGGGTFDANAGGSLINLSGLTINGFQNATDNIRFSGVTGTVDSYTITNGLLGGQTITLKDAGGNTLGAVTVAGTNLPQGTYTHGQSGPLGVIDNTATGTITINDGGGTVPCFTEGTRIRTPDGDVNVETLNIGDLVVTADGREEAVRWVGHRSVSTRFADPLRVLPIRIKAGALGENLPVRDLLLSPDHAVFMGGILVNAGALVNGTSIIRDESVPEIFTYYHVELARHELLLAEGTPSETFIDNIDRLNFHNWDARTAPNEAIAEMDYPRAKSHRQVPHAIRAALAARAAQMQDGEILAA